MTTEMPETRKKRLAYRAWHRGTREMDLILGRFADRRLRDMTAAELDAFEAILAAPDPALFAYVTGKGSAPEGLDQDLLAGIRAVAENWPR